METSVAEALEVSASFAEEAGEAFARSMEQLQASGWEKFILWMYDRMFEAVSNLFSRIGTMGVELFDMAWVQAFLRLFRFVGWTLFLAGLMVALFDTAVEYQTMRRIDGKHQVLPLIFGFLAVHMFSEVPVRLYVFCVRLQGIFMTELGDLFQTEVAAGSLGDAAGSALEAIRMSGNLTNLFFLLALAYCVLRAFFANVSRSGILLCQIAVGSLHLFALPKGNYEGFVLWMKQVIGLCLTAFLQMTMLYLGLLTWQVHPLPGLGIIIAASEVPRVAQQFGMETGMRSSMRGMMQSTVSAVHLTRLLGA